MWELGLSTSAAPSDGRRSCIGDLCMYHHEQTQRLGWVFGFWVWVLGCWFSRGRRLVGELIVDNEDVWWIMLRGNEERSVAGILGPGRVLGWA